jgi:hypothetical protein
MWVLDSSRFRNRANLSYGKERGIRLNEPKLGRPQTKSFMMKAEKLIERQDAKNRNAVEGKFDEGKRKYGLSRHRSQAKRNIGECHHAAILGNELGA